MAINIVDEEILSLAQATKMLPGRPHLSSIFRWMSRGVRGVRLESVLVGGRRYTSREALERFSAATTAAANREPAPIRTPTQRQRAIERAEKELRIAKYSRA